MNLFVIKGSCGLIIFKMHPEDAFYKTRKMKENENDDEGKKERRN